MKSIRLINATHQLCTMASTLQRHVDFDIDFHVKSYTVIVMLLVYPQGRSKFRQKKVSDFPSAYAYLNKVYVGGWMDDDSYREAWNLLLSLQGECGFLADRELPGVLLASDAVLQEFL